VTRTERQLADIDEAIAAAGQAAEHAAAEQATAEAQIAALLAAGKDDEAREAQAIARQYAADAELETRRAAGLKARRKQVEREAVDRASRLASVEPLLEKRERAAAMAEKAIVALRGYVAAIEQADAQLRTALPQAPDTADDVLSGVAYSMIAAGMPWITPNGHDAITAGNRLPDRVARSNEAIRSLK
jgi:hypothetical protein